MDAVQTDANDAAPGLEQTPAAPPTPGPAPAQPVRWGRYLSLAFVLLVIVGLVGLLGYAVFRQNGSSDVGERAHIADAPDFSFTDFNSGGTWQLSALRGKVVVVNFWASWCDPCREEAPTLEQTWQAWKDKNVVLLGADVNDPESDARAFLKEFNITYPNGPVPDSVKADYGLLGQPETFIVDPNGKITHRWLGAISRSKLDDWIQEAQSQ